jgi:type VI secretion system secreted protein VgrG
VPIRDRMIKVSMPDGSNVDFVSMQGTERLSQPFELRVMVRCSRELEAELEADKFLMKKAVVTLLANGTPLRYFHGFITDVALGGSKFGVADTGGRTVDYQITLRPWLWLLGQTSDCRVFQNMTVPAIVQEVCQKAGFTDLRTQLSGSYEPREYCVQFRETDLNFVSRLLEQGGISYFFEHSDSQHTLVLCDDVAALACFPGYEKVPCSSSGETFLGMADNSDYLSEWLVEQSIRSGQFATGDFDFKAPNAPLMETASIARDYNPARFETFDFPSLATTPQSNAVERVAKIRVEELQSSQMIARGSGDVRGLATGRVFTLTHHRKAGFNIKYLVTSTSISMSEGPDGGAGEFAVSIEATDASEAYRPPRITAKPLVHGLQTALVVGPKGQEIYTDAEGFGRVKVQFHWDRQGHMDEHSSCWIRVSQAWAGEGWGAWYLPRLGHEVVVAFLDGDPDRPVIVGSLYNGTHKPPFELPANATQSGVKSCSSLDGNPGNEIRFEDKKDAEQLYVQAQKDHQVVVNHDMTTTVGNDQTVAVSGNRKVSVSGNQTLNVGGNITLNAIGSITLKVGLTSLTLSEAGATLSTLGSVTVNGLNITVGGPTALTVSVLAPEGVITIASQSGVLNGPKVSPLSL